MSKTALDYSRGNLFMVPPEAIIIVGLDTEDGTEHELCHPESNAAPVDDAMVRSIMHNGVIEPIIVRKGPDEKHPECVAGRGRIRAAREANKRLHAQGLPEVNVPCVLRRGGEGDFEEVIIAENLIRKVMDPMESARQLKRFLDRGHSNADACRAFGVQKPTIRRWLELLELHPKVQTRVASGELTADAALGVAKLPRAEQNAALDAAVEASRAAGRKKVSGTATAKAAQALTQPPETSEDALPPVVRLAPTKGKLREVYETGAPSLHPEAFAMLRWVITGEGAQDVKGLGGLLRRD